jgi:hypothetical protein
MPGQRRITSSCRLYIRTKYSTSGRRSARLDLMPTYNPACTFVEFSKGNDYYA